MKGTDPLRVRLEARLALEVQPSTPREPVDEETLAALIDGRLSGARAAEVLERIAADPETFRLYNSIRRSLPRLSQAVPERRHSPFFWLLGFFGTATAALVAALLIIPLQVEPQFDVAALARLSAPSLPAADSFAKGAWSCANVHGQQRHWTGELFDRSVHHGLREASLRVAELNPEWLEFARNFKEDPEVCAEIDNEYQSQRIAEQGIAVSEHVLSLFARCEAGSSSVSGDNLNSLMESANVSVRGSLILNFWINAQRDSVERPICQRVTRLIAALR